MPPLLLSTSLTASTRSVTFGSNFHSLNISILLGANQLAWGGLAAMFKIVRLIFFALIVQLRISALFSKKMKGFSLMSLCYRMLKTCFHKG